MSELSSPRVYSMVFGIAEVSQALLLQAEVRKHPRFEIANVAVNAVLTVGLAQQLQPDVILLSDLSPGTPGRQVLEDLSIVAPRALVIITTGGDPRDLESRAEVAYAVGEYDVDALHRALDSTVAYLDSPEDEQPERRVQAERRVMQDWTQVFAERRVSVRRTADHLASPETIRSLT